MIPHSNSCTRRIVLYDRGMGVLSQYELDPSRTALLVIDMQNDFCKPDGFFAGAGHDVSTCQAAVDRTASLLEMVRPLGIPIFWSRSVNPTPPKYKLPPLRFRAPRESADFQKKVGGTNCFMPGSWGAEIVDELVPQAEDVVIDKTRYNVFHQTRLDDELRARGIDTIAVAGVTTNCCVETTARHGFINDYAMLVLSDCVAAFGNEWDLHEASLRNLELFFGVVATADDLVAELRERTAAAV
jgi:ureidoacrylate peracid hydrolase